MTKFVSIAEGGVRGRSSSFGTKSLLNSSSSFWLVSEQEAEDGLTLFRSSAPTRWSSVFEVEPSAFGSVIGIGCHGRLD